MLRRKIKTKGKTMDITELPFNKLIDLQRSLDERYLLTLSDDRKYTNHLGTVHAAALFSLAESTGGEFLLTNFPNHREGLIPVVRRAEVKYKKPATGQINSSATLIDNSIESIDNQLLSKNRASIQLKVDLFDAEKVNVMTAHFEWFVSKKI